MPSGPAPTRMFLLVTVPVTGLIRSTVPSPWLATHTPLGPLAMAAGTLPTRIVLTTLLAAALTQDTVPLPLLATHTLPPAGAGPPAGAAPAGSGPRPPGAGRVGRHRGVAGPSPPHT